MVYFHGKPFFRQCKYCMQCHMSANLLSCNVLSCLISSSLLSVLPICENIPGIPQKCQNVQILTQFAFLSFLKLQFIFFIDYTVSQGAAVMRLNMWTGSTVSLSLRVFFLTLLSYFLFFLFLSVSPSFFHPESPPSTRNDFIYWSPRPKQKEREDGAPRVPGIRAKLLHPSSPPFFSGRCGRYCLVCEGCSQPVDQNMAAFPNCERGPPLFLSGCVTLGLSNLKYFSFADFGGCSEGLAVSVLFCGPGI